MKLQLEYIHGDRINLPGEMQEMIQAAQNRTPNESLAEQLRSIASYVELADNEVYIDMKFELVFTNPRTKATETFDFDSSDVKYIALVLARNASEDMIDLTRFQDDEKTKIFREGLKQTVIRITEELQSYQVTHTFTKS